MKLRGAVSLRVFSLISLRVLGSAWGGMLPVGSNVSTVCYRAAAGLTVSWWLIKKTV